MALNQNPWHSKELVGWRRDAAGSEKHDAVEVRFGGSVAATSETLTPADLGLAVIDGGMVVSANEPVLVDVSSGNLVATADDGATNIGDYWGIAWGQKVTAIEN